VSSFVAVAIKPTALAKPTTLNDFTSVVGFANAVGLIATATNDDTMTLAIANTAGDQVGIYNVSETNTISGFTSGADGLALIAVVDVTAAISANPSAPLVHPLMVLVSETL
jgi:hypothetical protein